MSICKSATLDTAAVHVGYLVWFGPRRVHLKIPSPHKHFITCSHRIGTIHNGKERDCCCPTIGQRCYRMPAKHMFGRIGAAQSALATAIYEAHLQMANRVMQVHVPRRDL